MTADPARPGDGAPRGGRTGQWHDARTELIIAAVIAIAAAAAGYAMAGPQALVFVAIGTAVFALAFGRWLLPTAEAAPVIEGGTDDITPAWSGYRYWRYMSDLRDGMEARASYEMRLRPALEHLLAARLAERHSVNLYTDPEAARRLLCRGGRDSDLWEWIDPARASATAPSGPERHQTATRGSQKPGIPRRVLERLITRLEQL
jgi:hypothetical protein